MQFLNDKVVNGKRQGDLFTVQTEAGEQLTAKKLIFATGIKDIMPDIEGFAACWGITAIHCPYCHGFEFKGKKTAVLANGDRAVHTAALVNNLTDDLTVLTSGQAEFSEEQREKLRRNNIAVEEAAVTAFEHTQGHIRRVVFADGRRAKYDAVYAAIPFIQHSDLPEKLGCAINEGGYIEIDMFQKTSQSGIFACGDNTTYFRSVANAVAAGNTAGAMVNNELTQEGF